jgi:hypothetical protein
VTAESLDFFLFRIEDQHPEPIRLHFATTSGLRAATSDKGSNCNYLTGETGCGITAGTFTF